MSNSAEGVYRNGKVELLEPLEAAENARVIVTLAPEAARVDLATHGLSPEDAADLRWRLRAFTEDWEDPAMDVYDAL